MAKAVFKAREFTVKAKGSKEFVSEEMVRAKLFAARKKKEAESMPVFAAVIKPKKSGTEEQITPTDQVENGVEHEVVAIYDNAGIPSFMHRFRKVTNKELFGGSDKSPSGIYCWRKRVRFDLYFSLPKLRDQR